MYIYDMYKIPMAERERESDGQMDGRKEGWMDGRKDGRMDDGLIDRQITNMDFSPNWDPQNHGFQY